MIMVFGGSFNPPTKAHLNIITKLLLIYPDSRILLLPVGDDYFKPELIDIKDRIQMLELLISSIDRVSICELETKRLFKGTYASLNELSKKYDNLYYVIGMDNLLGIKKWIKYEELLKTYPFIIMNRKGKYNVENINHMFEGIKHQFTFIDFDEDISSTEARDFPEKRATLLTKEVLDYINENQLYKESSHV